MTDKAVYAPRYHQFDKNEFLIVRAEWTKDRTACRLILGHRRVEEGEVFLGTFWGPGNPRQPVDPKVIEKAKRRIHAVLNELQKEF